MKITEFIHPSYVNEFIRNYNTALAGTSVQLERKLQYKDKYVWWHLTYNPARNPDGEIIGISYNATDITQRVEHEQKVLAQNESLKKIAFVQSHELRRPVASIMGLMELVKNDKRVAGIEELQLMEEAVKELDEKIHLVVGYTASEENRAENQTL